MNALWLTGLLVYNWIMVSIFVKTASDCVDQAPLLFTDMLIITVFSIPWTLFLFVAIIAFVVITIVVWCSQGAIIIGAGAE